MRPLRRRFVARRLFALPLFVRYFVRAARSLSALPRSSRLSPRVNFRSVVDADPMRLDAAASQGC